MAIKYQIHGEDETFGNGEYTRPELYDTYEEAHARAHSNREWVRKVEVFDVKSEAVKSANTP